jgi:hypothetical protein
MFLLNKNHLSLLKNIKKIIDKTKFCGNIFPSLILAIRQLWEFNGGNSSWFNAPHPRPGDGCPNPPALYPTLHMVIFMDIKGGYSSLFEIRLEFPENPKSCR